MAVLLLPHARERAFERGATEQEVIATVEHGELFPAKLGRTGFRRNFPCAIVRRDRSFRTKQIEAIAVFEDESWLVVTVIVRYF